MSFFKRPQWQRSFNYQPRFYDPQKEARETRLNPDGKERLRRQWRKERHKQKAAQQKKRQQSNLRLLLIFCFLLLGANYLLKQNFEQALNSFFSPPKQDKHKDLEATEIETLAPWPQEPQPHD